MTGSTDAEPRLPARPLRLVLNGHAVTAEGVPPDRTLLDWLRGDPALRGTKEGCAEGDCGACTVIIEETVRGRVVRRPVNACLTLMGQVDGLGVRTVEGLAAPDAPLHPVQAAFAGSGATQCGFCTPGFVMAAYGAAAAGTPPEPAAIHDALAGNLCRCTGYRPIVEAVAGLLPLADDPLARGDAALAETLRGVARPGDVRLAAGGARFDAPRRLDAALALRARFPDALLLAGGTDLGLRASHRRERLPHVIHLGRVRALLRLTAGPAGLAIGAAVPYETLLPALTRAWPEARGLLTRLGSRQIRALGTLGGNLGTASPIGDGLPLLLALDATVRLRSAARGARDVAMADFVTGYRATALAADELIELIRIPARAPGTRLVADKLSKRRDQDIATVCGVFRLRLTDGVARDVRLAFGGMAAIPTRARAAEAALDGRPLDEDAVATAIAALPRDLAPRDDWRGSAVYRLQAAGNLLRRLQLRLARPGLPLELDAL